jgi:uncharacterized membrane protein YphA (DoxX/SURF4 family)
MKNEIFTKLSLALCGAICIFIGLIMPASDIPMPFIMMGAIMMIISPFVYEKKVKK